jgi:Transposase zinc-ribbon domain
MKHLIPYLQDDRKAADYLRQLRWPEGVTCPRCGSDVVEPREPHSTEFSGWEVQTHTDILLK